MSFLVGLFHVLQLYIMQKCFSCFLNRSTLPYIKQVYLSHRQDPYTLSQSRPDTEEVTEVSFLKTPELKLRFWMQFSYQASFQRSCNLYCRLPLSDGGHFSSPFYRFSGSSFSLLSHAVLYSGLLGRLTKTFFVCTYTILPPATCFIYSCLNMSVTNQTRYGDLKTSYTAGFQRVKLKLEFNF